MSSISAPTFHSPSPSSSSSCSNLIPAGFQPRRPAIHVASFLPKKPAARGRGRSSESMLCRCQNPASGDPPPGGDSGGQRGKGWDFVFHDAVRAAVRRWEDYVSSFRAKSPAKDVGGGVVMAERKLDGVAAEEEKVGTDWDWERWKRHFDEVEEQERIVSVLRSQLRDAILREDYKDAAKFKRAIAAAAENDVVGSAIKHLNQAIEEERYRDAAIIRDHAGTGLIGWWSGISKDSTNPYGRIIRITAEHGRYMARSYSSRQLASGKSGFPIFEIYFTVGNDGQYVQQAVYLKRNDESSGKTPKNLTKASVVDSSGPSALSEGENDIPIKEEGDGEESDVESDVSDDLPGIQNVLQDMIPGVNLKVLKVIAPGKVDKDLISKVIEQIIEEEDDETDADSENVEPEDNLKTESDSEIEVDTEEPIIETMEEPTDLSMKFVISGIMQNLSVDVPPKDLIRVPAKLERQDRFTFSFSILKDDAQLKLLPETIPLRPPQRSTDVIMSDLARVLTSKEKIPLKVLKDVGELLNATVNQNKSHLPLRGTTVFNRIDNPTSSDPLSGLYVSARGMLSSEVLYLRRKFGQWQDDENNRESLELEFYEYVEALKLTGDLSVPAGQVAFRAKVGKQYQLPHKGIIPEEFGVVARFKGQGRLAEPGFQNPKWVDGELVILDGRYVREGPVIGFVYWAPEYHFLMFFNRLQLQN